MLFSIVDSSCASAPCCNGGTCRNVDSSFECSCPAGFMGERCEIEGKLKYKKNARDSILTFTEILYLKQLNRCVKRREKSITITMIHNKRKSNVS
jgi:hypothetical protein